MLLQKIKRSKSLRQARARRGLGGVYGTFLDAATATPLIRLRRLEKAIDTTTQLYAKLEYANAATNHKLRTVNRLLGRLHAEKEIIPGKSTIIEPVDFQLGFAIASFCTIHNYRAILTIPEDTPIEHQDHLRKLGATVIATPTESGFDGADAKARQLFSVLPDALMLQEKTNQNKLAVLAHTTIEEILFDSRGDIHAFVANTVNDGLLAAAKSRFAADGHDIAVFGSHKQGVEFSSSFIRADELTGLMKVTEQAWQEASALLAIEEGMIIEETSALAIASAIELARDPDYKEKRVIIAFTGMHQLAL